MSTPTTPAAPAAAPTTTPTPTPAPAATATPNPAPAATPAATPAPAANALDFVPESLRGEGWVSKYSTPEDFWKGVDSTIKMVGQKQIVQGIQLPGEDAKPEDYDNFFKQIGRPEKPEEYKLPEDVKAFEGFDLASEKTAFMNLAHKNGLSQRQAAGLFKDYINAVNETNAKSVVSLDDAKKKAFPENTEAHYGLANKGAQASGEFDNIEKAGLGREPIVMRLCAKIAELSGESIHKEGDDTPKDSASLLAEAKRLQASAEYRNGDKSVRDKVTGIYQQVYGKPQ